jgi:hypothetical protein
MAFIAGAAATPPGDGIEYNYRHYWVGSSKVNVIAS